MRILRQIPPDKGDVWEDDPEDDELDKEDAETLQVAQVILDKRNSKLEHWAETAQMSLNDVPVEQELLGHSAMQKVIKLGQCCTRKSALQRKLVCYCGLKKIPVLKMVKCVPTRWNTMYNVVDCAITLRQALDVICKSLELDVSHLIK